MWDTLVLAYYYQNNNNGNKFIIMKRRELFVSTLHGQTCRSVENKHFIKLTTVIYVSIGTGKIIKFLAVPILRNTKINYFFRCPNTYVS